MRMTKIESKKLAVDEELFRNRVTAMGLGRMEKSFYYLHEIVAGQLARDYKRDDQPLTIPGIGVFNRKENYTKVATTLAARLKKSPRLTSLMQSVMLAHGYTEAEVKRAITQYHIAVKDLGCFYVEGCFYIDAKHGFARYV